MFWPGMSRDMESFVKEYTICIRHWKQTNKREPLILHHK